MPAVLIVEDDPAIAQTLSFALKKQGFDVVWVQTMREALDLLPTCAKLSAIVMDIGLPDGSGLTLCQKIRFGGHHACVPILFLTAKSDELDKLLGLEMGADDYITKPFSPKEVIARLNAIWRRQGMEQQIYTHQTTSERNSLSAISSGFVKVLSTGKWQYQATTYTLSLNDCPLTLSKTELAIMLSLLEHPSQVLSREQLLSAISEHPEHRLARTIDAHIKTLRQKLSLVSHLPIITTHRGLGYSIAK